MTGGSANKNKLGNYRPLGSPGGAGNYVPLGSPDSSTLTQKFDRLNAAVEKLAPLDKF